MTPDQVKPEYVKEAIDAMDELDPAKTLEIYNSGNAARDFLRHRRLSGDRCPNSNDTSRARLDSK